jgi:hypothetical protein
VADQTTDRIAYQDFSQQVKGRHPEYKDVPDEELAKAMIEKYPVYKDRVYFSKSPLQPQPPGSTGLGYQARQFAGGVWDTAKGVAEMAVEALPNVSTGPKPGAGVGEIVRDAVESTPGGRLITGAVDNAVSRGKKAVDLARQKRYVEAAGQAGAAVPMIGQIAGPIADTAGGREPTFDKYGNILDPGAHPNPSRAAGQATAAALLPKAIEKAVPVLKTGGAAVNRSAVKVFGANPHVAIAKSLDIMPTETIPQTLATLHDIDPNINGVEDLIAAAKRGIKNHQDALEEWMKPKREMGVAISGDPIVEATRQALAETLKLENPTTAKRIMKEVESAYGGKTFTVDKYRQFLREKNAELRSFYDQATGKQQASVTSGSPQAVVKAQRDAIAKKFYSTLDPENEGAGPQAIQSQTGDLTEILDAADKRRKASLQEKPVTKIGALGKAAAGTAGLPLKLAEGKFDEGLSNITGAFGGKIDPLIRRALANAGKPEPLPRPSTVRYNPRGGQMGRPQLGAASLRPPPPPDTSGPIDPTLPQTRMLKAGAAEVPGAPASRQLPAPPIVTPPPPDTSGAVPSAGPRPGAGLGQQVGERQLPTASGPIKQPGTAVQDMVPVRDPETGQVTYHSQADLRDINNMAKLPGTTFTKPSGDKFTVKAVDETKGTTTYEVVDSAGVKKTVTRPTEEFKKLVAGGRPQQPQPPGVSTQPQPPQSSSGLGTH